MQNSFFQIVQATESSRRAFELHPSTLNTATHGLTLPQYQTLLQQLYHIVWHFNPISATAVSRLTDHFKPQQSFLYSHMLEEAGHSDWVLQDLKHLNLPHDPSSLPPPSPPTQCLIAYNYYAAERIHPCSALGMLYALEIIASIYGNPLCLALQDSLLLQPSLPDNPGSPIPGLSFLSSHATLDTHHLEDLKQTINSISDPIAISAISQAACINFHQFSLLIQSINPT